MAHLQRWPVRRTWHQLIQCAVCCDQALWSVALSVYQPATTHFTTWLVTTLIGIHVTATITTKTITNTYLVVKTRSAKTKTKNRQIKYKQVRPSSGTDLYPHMPILRPHAARFHERRVSCVTFMSEHLYGNVYMQVGVARALANFGLLGE